jgi:hypothetical protein
MTYSYYIYYRVAAGHEAACAQRVAGLMALIARETGIAGRVLKKRREPLLWMEVYENVPDEAAFERALAQAVAAAKADECLQAGSSRRIECFECA